MAAGAPSDKEQAPAQPQAAWMRDRADELGISVSELVRRVMDQEREHVRRWGRERPGELGTVRATYGRDERGEGWDVPALREPSATVPSV